MFRVRLEVIFARYMAAARQLEEDATKEVEEVAAEEATTHRVRAGARPTARAGRAARPRRQLARRLRELEPGDHGKLADARGRLAHGEPRPAGGDATRFPLPRASRVASRVAGRPLAESP
jgi:hypothetical protein